MVAQRRSRTARPMQSFLHGTVASVPKNPKTGIELAVWYTFPYARLVTDSPESDSAAPSRAVDPFEIQIQKENDIE